MSEGWQEITQPPEKSGFYLVYDENAMWLDEKTKIEIYRYSKDNDSWYWGADCFHPQYWNELPTPPGEQAPKEVRECYVPVTSDCYLDDENHVYITSLGGETIGIAKKVSLSLPTNYYNLFKEDFIAHADRLLRDRGASNKDVFECLELAFEDLRPSLSLPKGECYMAIEIKDEKDLPTETDAYICILEKKEHGVRTEIASLMEYRTAYGQFHDNNDGFKVKTWFKPLTETSRPHS